MRLVVLALLVPITGSAQAARDSARADSTRSQALPTVQVTATGSASALERVPWAVGFVDARGLRLAQPTVGLDEALSSIPGVFVANRYNFAVDSRVSIRGFGSRANFGVRGVKVLLDGVPQTMPDGQSQMTNIELGAMARAEVLRGSTSSLWGNGSGGVLAFTSDMSAPAPIQQSLRYSGGSFGERKWLARTSGRVGDAVGMLTLSRLTVDGFRQYSDAEVRQLVGGVDYAIGDATSASLRLELADVPRASNPGALTAAEYLANRDSAAATNVLRGADKRSSQNQLSLTLRRSAKDGGEWTLALYGGTRDLKNAIASPPPGGGAPTNGTYIEIDRGFGGARLALSEPLFRAALGARAPTLTAGIDAQRMRDDRRNWRDTRGRPTAPTDTSVLHQIETTTSVGPFAQLAWSPVARVLLSAGGRYDRVNFDVADRFLRDGEDDSGARGIPAWSGHLGASLTGATAFSPYANVSSSFETPTTTELQARRDGMGGFNPDLGPQRAIGLELGARGTVVERVTYSASVYRTRVRDALVQFLETGGRAYFRNAGSTHNDGAEIGLDLRASDALSLEGAYTYSRFRFGEYRVQSGARIDTLDGNRLPGVPDHQLRVGFRSRLARGLTLDADHTWSSAVYADDLNALRVEGWGPGILNARVAWSPALGGSTNAAARLRVEPFLGVQNALGRAYVSAVTVNGAFGRVREPGPRRAIYLGMEVGGASR
jgi:iron complex outermembrane receptor protein